MRSVFRKDIRIHQYTTEAQIQVYYTNFIPSWFSDTTTILKHDNQSNSTVDTIWILVALVVNLYGIIYLVLQYKP